MKKILALFLVLIFVFLQLMSCNLRDFLNTDSQHLLLTACVYYSVPGFYQPDLKGNSANVLEIDDYGRTLVSFEGYNWMTNKDECVYVICQKYCESTIYFYENINYIWGNEVLMDLENLKKENDWNSEIEEAKFSTRKINVSIDLCLVNDFPISNFSNEKFYFSLFERYGIIRDSIISVNYCDWDGQCQILYLINLNSGEKFFCIVDKDYNTFIEKNESQYSCSEAICKLKKQSNWHYGL